MRFPLLLSMVLADGCAPAIARWVAAQEKRILKEGQPLDGEMRGFAEALGIGDASKVRVMIVDRIPLPVSPGLVERGMRAGFPMFAPGGMALGRGIYLLPGHGRSLPHELVHVAQYERLGGIVPFIWRYVVECLNSGYSDAPLEVEAREKSGEFPLCNTK